MPLKNNRLNRMNDYKLIAELVKNNNTSQDKSLIKQTVLAVVKEIQSSFGREVSGKNKNIFNLQAQVKIAQIGGKIIEMIDDKAQR